MKLQNELQGLIEKMEANKVNIVNHAQALKESGKYQDFETRLAWDALKSVIRSSIICEWYTTYNCNDDHITTLAKKALKSIYPIVEKTKK